MANYRQIHVSIWKDSWFLDLVPDEKLLYIYLFSNESTSLSGIYRIARRVIYFETGIDKKRADEILQKFEDDGKVFTQGDVIWLLNMRKYHETASIKVQTRIELDIRSIPDCELKKQYIAYYQQKIPYEYPTDTSSLKEEEEKEVKEEMNNNPYRQLSAAFCNATSIPELTGGVEKWVSALEKLGSAGVEPDDIDTAVQELRNKNYSIVSLSSIVNAAITVMSKRKSSKPILEGYTYVGDE